MPDFELARTRPNHDLQNRRMRWMTRWFSRQRPTPVGDAQRARDLIAAVDAGGMPLNPARVNAIARSLGLEVTPHDPVDDTIERIRAAVARLGP